MPKSKKIEELLKLYDLFIIVSTVMSDPELLEMVLELAEIQDRIKRKGPIFNELLGNYGDK